MCPTEARADVPASPPPPRGMDADKLSEALIALTGSDDFWQWLTTDLHNHDVEVTARLTAVHVNCIKSTSTK